MPITLTHYSQNVIYILLRLVSSCPSSSSSETPQLQSESLSSRSDTRFLFCSCLASLEIRTREPSSRTIVRLLLRASTFPGSRGNSIMLCGSRVGEGIWLGEYTIGLKKN